MSGNISSLTTDMISKRELAQCILKYEDASKGILESAFKGVMQALEIRTHMQIPDSIQNRVWCVVSGEKLRLLKETFIIEFCKKTLSEFNEQEVSAMLETHKETGTTRDIPYRDRLQAAFESTRSSMIETITDKIVSVAQAWFLEVARAVEQEGIRLSWYP